MAPAPVGSSVTVAGRLTRTQCQKPDGTGASGSKQVTTKALVSAGKPDQLSCGELLPPAKAWSSDSCSRSATSVLVTVKVPAFGSSSYGSGVTGRSSDIWILRDLATCGDSDITVHVNRSVPGHGCGDAKIGDSGTGRAADVAAGNGVEDVVEQYLDRIGPADEVAMRAATERQAGLTKPAGSLGVLEELSVRVAGMTGSCPPAVPAPAVVTVFAADHGVHAQGVSPWPQEVTAAMLANFAAGGAAVNAFAANNRVDVRVVDVGVATPVDELDIVHAKVRARHARPVHDRRPDRGRDPGRDRGRLRPGGHAGQGRLPVPAHRRHGDREHHRERRPDRHLHRLDRRRGHRPRHRHRRRHAGPQDRDRAVRSGAARRTGDRPAQAHSRRTAASSMRPWPGTSSVARPTRCR